MRLSMRETCQPKLKSAQLLHPTNVNVLATMAAKL